MAAPLPWCSIDLYSTKVSQKDRVAVETNYNKQKEIHGRLKEKLKRVRVEERLKWAFNLCQFDSINFCTAP